MCVNGLYGYRDGFALFGYQQAACQRCVADILPAYLVHTAWDIGCWVSHVVPRCRFDLTVVPSPIPGGTSAKCRGVGKGTATLEDFDYADAIFSFGHNPSTNHPRMTTTLHQAARRGVPIVVFNPSRSAHWSASLHLRIRSRW